MNRRRRVPEFEMPGLQPGAHAATAHRGSQGVPAAPRGCQGGHLRRSRNAMYKQWLVSTRTLAAYASGFFAQDAVRQQDTPCVKTRTLPRFWVKSPHFADTEAGSNRVRDWSVFGDSRRGARGLRAGDDRLAGATYDPTSHYRAVAVFDFFRKRGLTPAMLREVSQHQIGRLASSFDALDLDPAILSRDRSCPVGEIGGFLALRSPFTADLVRGLRARGVWTDARGDVLRLGPAPYLSDRQLEDAIGLLGEVVRETAS